MYKEPGSYTIFVRIEGEEIPLSTSRIVVYSPTDPGPTRSSTIVYDARRQRVYAVNPDHNSISAIDARNPRLLFEVPVGKHPRTIALDGDGNLWVACQDDATLHVVSGEDGRHLDIVRLPFASRPYGITFSPDTKTAYASLEATGKLVKLIPASRSVAGFLDLGPTPRGIAVSHDGMRVLVTRHISPMTAPGAADHAEVWEVDGSTFTRVRTFRLEADTSQDGATSGRGIPNGLTSISITPDGRYAMVPATKANTQRGQALDGRIPDFQTTVRTLIARIDLRENREDMAFRKDVDNRSIGSSVAFDKYGRYAFLTTQGTNQTPILLTHSLGDFSSVSSPDNPPDLLARGEGRELAPIGSVLAVGDSLLFIHYFLSREVGVYDVSRLGWETPGAVARVKTVGKEILTPEIFLGKQIFYNSSDIRMSKDGYISCVVCHIDGGTDGRVWDFTDRGEGLRRTTDLRGRAGMGHGPVHWSANFDEIQDFEQDIRGPFAGKGFLEEGLWLSGTRNQSLGDKKAGLSPELDALAAYVSSLIRVPSSPYRNGDGSLTEAGRRGRGIFNREDVGCFKCHTPPHFTDSRLPDADAPPLSGSVSIFKGAASRRTAEGFLLHDVGTQKPSSGLRMNDTLFGMDTPTLKGVWTGGPFLHDGSAPSLMHVLEDANPQDRHGKTSHLTRTEMEELIAYLKQIDDLDDQGNAPIRKQPERRALGAGPELSVEIFGRHVRIHYRFSDTAGSPSAIHARLFDVQGKLMAVFYASGRAREGYWTWKGGDRQGSTAAPGLYLLQIDSPGKARTVLPIVLR